MSNRRITAATPHQDASGVAGLSLRHVAGAPRPPSGPYDADVIILALDRAEDTCAAIDSACAQRGVTRHVTVLDQGSSPTTLARLANHVAGLSDVTLLALERNLGVPAGRNIATRMGHGRVIAGLDNDAEFATQHTLAQAVAALEADPKVGVIGCRIVSHGSGADDLTSWGYPMPLLARSSESFDVATFVGAGHAIRRTAWDEAGGYDESLFFCWEEYDFALRVITAGWRITYRGEIEIRHKAGAERRVGWSDRRWFQHVRNRLYIARKYGASWIGLSPRIAAYLVKGLRNRRLPQTLRAVAEAGAMPLAGKPRLPAAAKAYLRETDTAARGAWRDRLRNEVFARLPQPVPAPRSNEHRSGSVVAIPLLGPRSWARTVRQAALFGRRGRALATADAAFDQSAG